MTTDDRSDQTDFISTAANDDAPQQHSGEGTAGSAASNNANTKAIATIVDRDADGIGRLVLSFEHDQTSRLGNDDPRFVRNVAASKGAANDNVIWVGDDGDHNGIYARDGNAVTLTNGDIAVAWIGADQIVHARVYSAASEDHFEFPADQPLTLKATLADLGMASALSHSLQSRLKLSALPDSGFVAAWTTELALATILFSKAFLPSDAAQASDAQLKTTSYTTHDLPPLAVPRGRTAFTIQTTHAHKLDVTFLGHDGGHDDVVHTASIALDTATPSAPGNDLQAAKWERASINAVLVSAQDDGAAGASHAERVHSGHASAAPDSHDARDDESQVSTSSDNNRADSGEAHDTTVHLTNSGDPGLDAAIAYAREKLANAGTHSEVTIGQTDNSGHAPILVNGHQIADKAVIYDAQHPHLDLSPSATNVGGNTGVSYVQETAHADGSSTKALVAAVVSETGHITGGEPMTVATTDGSHTTFSQIDIAAAPVRESEHAATVAVAWVNNADDNGYGTVSTQLYHVENGGDNDATGSVTAIDGNGDAAGTEVDLNGAAAGDVIGRSPDAQGLSDGSLAVAWVQHSDVGSTEQVHAVVIGPGSSSVQALDLGDDMPSGILAGTSPALTAAPDGELIVSWLQAALAGGNEAAAKIFKHVADVWLANGPVVILAHFDDVPQTFTIASASISSSHDDGGGAIALAVAWHDASGTAHGTTVEVSTGALAANDDTSGSNIGHGSSHVDDSNSGPDLKIADVPTVVTCALTEKADGSGAASDNSGSGSHHDAGADADAVAVCVTAAVDLSSDTISFASAASSQTAGASIAICSSTSCAVITINDQSAPTQSDLNSAIAQLAPDLSTQAAASNSGHGSSGSETTGPGSDTGSGSHSSSGSGPAAVASNDNIHFTAGFGNDAPDFVAPADHGGHHDDVIALFDDLQMANAFNQMANDEVLTFDANNVATLTNFNDHHGRGGSSFFDTA